MKTKLNKFGLGMAASVVMLMALPSAQAQIGFDTFVTDPFGDPVKDPFDECIQSAGGLNVPQCLDIPAVIPPPAPPPEPFIETFTLSADTNFDFDKAVLRPEGQRTLEQLVEEIRRTNDIQSILVVGHTDSIGTEAYNQRLSERRAESVRDYLVQLGVNPDLITARGMGETQPIAPNTINGRDNPEGRAQNRRVEITVEALRREMAPAASPAPRS